MPAHASSMSNPDAEGRDAPGLLRRALHHLQPHDANRHPALFLLEIVAALLTVLALRAALLGAPTATAELACAAGLWAAALATACRLSGRGR